MVNSTIHWINLCPVSEAFGLPNPYPLDSAIQRLNNPGPVEQLGTVQERICPIDYFPIAHNTLCLPPKFCITYCLKMLLGKMQYSQEHLKTMVYAEFGGQTECVMGNWKTENKRNCVHNAVTL